MIKNILVKALDIVAVDVTPSSVAIDKAAEAL